VTGLLFGAFLLAHFIHPLSSTISNFPVREIDRPLTSAQLEGALKRWADANGYGFGKQRDWWVTKEWNTQRLGTIRVAELSPAGLFSAWHIGPGGLAWRALPSLRVTCVSTDNPPDAFVSIDPGLYSHDSPEEQTWPAVLDSLAESLHTGSPIVSSAAQSELHPDRMWPLIFAYGVTALCLLIAFGIARHVRSMRTL